MSKLERWLTLVANLSVVAGIVLLAAEMRQNTQAIQAQTRDSVTEKQMEYAGWLATTPELASAEGRAFSSGLESLDAVERRMWFGYVNAILREWESSYYQFRQGLFTAPEFEARRANRAAVTAPAFSEIWQSRRDFFVPDFRAEIDRIVAEVEQAR